MILTLSWFRLSSLDIGYHLGYGATFLDTGKIVGAEPDPFLYPETGVPFVNANWGSQVVMAVVDRMAGPFGLIMLRMGLVVVIFSAMAVVVRSKAEGWVTVAWAWAIAAFAAYERFSLRPELMSYAVMMLQVAIWARGVRSWRSASALVMLQILWVNLHSYFLVGVLLAGAFWIDAAWAYWNRLKAFGDVRAAIVRRFKLMTITGLLMAAACTVHPWGVRGALFPLETLSFLKDQQVMGNAAGEQGRSAMSEISEFESPFARVGERINRNTIYAYFVVLGLIAPGFFVLFFQRKLGWAAAVMLLLVMSLQMRRNIAQFSLAAVPLVMAAVGSINWSNLFSISQRRTLRRGGATIVALACSLFSWQVASGRAYLAERRTTREFGGGYHPRTFPIDAMKWLAAQEDLQPRLFVDYFTSSNVIPWLPERFKLFVDTNTFAYRDETLRTAFDLGLGKTPHGPFFDQYGVNVVLLHCGPDTQLLVGAMMKDDANWALVYADPTAVVFARRLQAQVQVIIDNPVNESSIRVADWIAGADGPDASRALALGTIANVPMSLGWWRTAAEICTEAVRVAPAYDEARHYLGVANLNLGNAAARNQDVGRAKGHYEKAMASFEQVLLGTPNHPEARLYLGISNLILGNAQATEGDLAGARTHWSAAKASFDAVLERMPGHSEAARYRDIVRSLLSSNPG